MADYKINKLAYGSDTYSVEDSGVRKILVDSGQKNLLNVFLSPGANPQNGITWLVHPDGTITANGTATANSFFYIWPNNTNKVIGKSTILCGCPAGGSSTTYEMGTASSGGTAYRDYGSGQSFNASFSFKYITCAVRSGYTANNLTFRPMLCTADDYAISTEFQPYRHSFNDLYSRYLDEGAKNKLKFTSLDVGNANGRTFTLNSDGSVTVTGTPTSTSQHSIATLQIGSDAADVAKYCNGLYILTGCPSGGGTGTYRVTASRSSYAVNDYGSGALLVLASGSGISVKLQVNGNYTIGTSGVTFKPMVCSLEDYAVSQSYQPYRPTYQELYDMVKALQ